MLLVWGVTAIVRLCSLSFYKYSYPLNIVLLLLACCAAVAAVLFSARHLREFATEGERWLNLKTFI